MSRSDLFNLVWSEPMKTASRRFEISDVALRKRCVQAEIPVPPVGHWQRVAAGKKFIEPKLPPRAPGMSDEIWFVNRFSRVPTEAELMEPPGKPPSFEEKMELVRQRCEKLVGKISVPREFSSVHDLIRKRLDEDESRRAAKAKARGYFSIFDGPRFDDAFEQRRLRILNALFLACARAGAKPDLRGRMARDISVRVHDQWISLRLERDVDMKGAGRSDWDTKPVPPGAQLQLAILASHGSDRQVRYWSDKGKHKLETDLRDVVIEILVDAERRYRNECDRRYQQRVEWREQLSKEREEAEQRAEQARVAQLETDRLKRIEELTSAADAHDRSERLRRFIKKVEASNATLVGDKPAIEWAAWAKGIANEIDPLVIVNAGSCQ